MMKDKYRSSPSPTEWLLLLLVVAWGVIQRWYGIDRQGLWADELFAVANSYAPHFSHLYPTLLGDSHPPGYLSFMYFTLPWTDYSDTGIRFHAFAAGSLLLVVVYALGRRYFTSTTGLVAALLLAGNLSAIEYSQEARAYSLLMLFSWIHVYYFIAIFIERNYTYWSLLIVNIAGVAILYLHYSAMVFIGLEALFAGWLCIQKRDWSLALDGLKTFLFPLLSFIPWMGVMLHHMTHTTYWGVRPTLADLQWVWLFFVGRHPFDWLLHAICIMYTAICTIQYMRGNTIRSDKNTGPIAHKLILLFILLAFPPLVFFLKSQVSQPVFVDRYLIASLPAAILLTAIPVAMVFEKIVPRRLYLVCILLSSIAFGYWQFYINSLHGLYVGMNKQPFREATSILRDDLQLKNERFVIFSTHPHVRHYLQQMGVLQRADLVLYDPITLSRIETYLSAHPVDYFYVFEVAPDPSVLPAINERYHNTCTSRMPWIYLGKYETVGYEPAKHGSAESERPCP